MAKVRKYLVIDTKPQLRENCSAKFPMFGGTLGKVQENKCPYFETPNYPNDIYKIAHVKCKMFQNFNISPKCEVLISISDTIGQ